MKWPRLHTGKLPGTLLLLVAVSAVAGCASFGPVRPAEVTAGPSATGRVSLAAPPGDDAAWLWSFFCAQDCNRSILGYELDYIHGFVPEGGGRPFEVGAGISGIYPFVHGYMQLGVGERPWGVGARVGVPVTGWHQHQLYARHDLALAGGNRLILNPALFLHTGNSPNGENSGTFIALVPSVGLEIPHGRVSLLPSASLVTGWTDRRHYSQSRGSAVRTTFPTFSIGVMVRPPGG
jgi:hypothetical protein